MSNSQTPQFDALLDTVLLNLKPHTRECSQKEISKYCEGSFDITDEDISFFKLLRVPPPLCCPTCRRQKRFAFVNRSNLYKRKNDAPGQANPIISFVPPNAPFTVYNYEYYSSPAWDPFSYGRDYEIAEPFFEQLFNLRKVVPQPALIKDSSNINYEYSLNGRNSKNVYCSSGIFDSEDVWYCIFLTKSRQIMDSHKAPRCENSYNLIYCEGMSNCNFAYYSKDCIDSWFLYDCRNAQHCFGCVNVRNKQYCFFNEQLTKEEYEKRVKDLHLETISGLKKAKDAFWKFVKANPVLASRSSRAIDSTGVIIVNSKDCKNCIAAEKVEHERYVDTVISHRDSMDVYASGASELLYQVTGSGSDTANSKFLTNCKFITHSEYMINCRNCQNCFGCIGLENKKHCIFNKPYEPEEYFKKLDTIKSELFQRGEYGELFPYSFSAFAYNGSEADDVYPLSEEEVKKLGALWQEDVSSDFSDLKALRIEDLPNSINNVTDDIIKEAIICEETGKPFRVIASELAYYRRKSLPLPTVHPYQRMKNFFKHMGNQHAYDATCENCSTQIKTIYKKEEGWHLFCEACFQNVVV